MFLYFFQHWKFILYWLNWASFGVYIYIAACVDITAADSQNNS